MSVQPYFFNQGSTFKAIFKLRFPQIEFKVKITDTLNLLIKPMSLISYVLFLIVQIGHSQVTSATLDPSNSYCQWSAVTVNYVFTGTTSDIKLYISDVGAPGTFSTPEIATQSTASGSIAWAVPDNFPAGQYNFRLDSGTPVGSVTTGNFIVKERTITPTYPTGAPFDPGEMISVPVSIGPNNCPFNLTNQFHLELSDAAGSFSSPTVLIAVLDVDATTLSSNIPNVPFGTGYRLRVKSTNPMKTSVMSSPFTINPTFSSTACVCNNDQTPNNHDGTYSATLILRNADNSEFVSGLDYSIVSSTGLFNTSGGALGTPNFLFCDGSGCPSGVSNGQYYLQVHIQNSGAYTANVDGPDANASADFMLTTMCATLYPALPIIPFDNVNCLNPGLNNFSSDGGVYNLYNLLTPISLPSGYSQTGVNDLILMTLL